MPGGAEPFAQKFSQVAQNTLKQIAVSAISTAEDICGTIYIIIDYRVGIFRLNVNKCDVTDTLLSHGAAEVSFNLRNPLNDRSAEHDMILESYAKIDSN